MTEWIGRTLSKVQIHQLLARGGMAELYLGTHTTLGRPVAVKVLRSHFSADPDSHERFEREARAVATLRHPNIVQVFDFDVADNYPYMVMEYITGLSLEDYLGAGAPAPRIVPPDVAARLVAGIAAALDYAHGRGIIHRDIKPANVMLRYDAAPIDPAGPLPAAAEPVLTDFGVMRMIGGGRLTAAGMVFGTPVYMSPEQARGETVDGRSDIYSLGAMLYEMLSGGPPFDPAADSPSELLIKHISAPPPPLRNGTPALQRVLDRALAKDPAARYQTAQALAGDLQIAVADPSGTTLAARTLPAGPGPPAAEPAPVAGSPVAQYGALLKTIDIFQGLDDAFLGKVARLLVEQWLPAGTLLFHQGDPGDVLYIVLAGRIKIFTRPPGGTEKVFAFNNPGSFFGEMALLTGEPRSASARAMSDSRLLVLAKADFDQLLADNSVIPRLMLQAIARRQATINRRLVEDPDVAAPPPTAQGQVWAIYSPKGGAGTTMVAANLAVALAQTHPGAVALLDLSLPFGQAAALLNLVPRVALGAIRPVAWRDLDRESLDTYLLQHASGLRLLVGAQRLEDRDAVTVEHVQAALEVLRRYFAYIVVDTATALSDVVLAAIVAADRTVLLATPARPSLQDLHACSRLFTEILGVPRERLRYVLNHPQPTPTLRPDAFAHLLQQPLDGIIPFDATVPALAIEAGEPFVLTAPGSPVASAILQLATALA